MNLNKGISTPIAIGFIVVISVVVGVLIWQFTKPAGEPTPKQPSDYTTQAACQEANYYWYEEACHKQSQTTGQPHEDYKQVVSKNFAYSDSEQATINAAMNAPGGMTLDYYFKSNEDNVYVFFDNIKIYDSEGNSKSSFRPVVPASDMPHGREHRITAQTGLDFVVEEDSNVDILFSEGIEWFLARFSSAGELQEKISLDNFSSELRDKDALLDRIYLVDNKIYLKGDSKSYLVGRIKNNKLKKVESRPEFKGVLGSTSGNWYEVEIVEKGKEAIVKVLDSSGTELKTITIERERLASIAFLGEDQDGNIYIQVERSIGSDVKLEVHKFNPEGKHLTTINIPNNDYKFWSNRLLFVGKGGTVWQVFPAEDGWHMNRWSNIY